MVKNKNTKATKGSTGWFRKLGLVLWKNLQYRMRCLGCCTGCEILFPVICVFMQLFVTFNIRGMVGSGVSVSERNDGTHQPWTIQSLGQDFKPCGYDSCNYILAFYPPKAHAFIDTFVLRVNEATKKTSSKGPVGNDPKFAPKVYDSEEELETFVAETFLENNRKKAEGSWKDKLNYVAAIIFTKGIPQKTEDPEISYTIRLPVDKHEQIETHELYPSVRLSYDQRSDGKSDWYRKSGFTLFQLILDNLIIQDALKLNTKSKSTIPNVTIEQFSSGPTPGTDDKWKISKTMNQSSGFFLVIGFMVMVSSIILAVMSEKNSGIKELMKIMGLPNWIHWLGWMLNSMIVHMISVSLVVILMHFISFDSGTKPIWANSNPFFMWISLYLYTLSGIAFSLFISSLFQTPITAVIVGLVVWIASYFVTALAVDPYDHEKFRMSEILALALLPNYAFHLLLTLTSRYEAQAIGAQWSNIAKPMNSEMPLSLAHVWVMFLADTILYSLLAVYLENVLPSEFGIRKPWYYPFWSLSCNKLRLPSRRKKRAVQVQPVINAEPENTTGFEAEPIGLNAGVIVTNLSKQFGRKIAVNNLSFKMFDGQITALLGHNGAGKTTTMSILTGMIPPTSGTATVNGFDIRTQMNKVRRSMGLCPQHNLLFEKLSVRQHLIFFGHLKGLSWREAKKETSSLLEMVGMPEKVDVLASELSGGQKRKLCLCMALIGGSKVLILDEPTSGMDSDARRAIWNIFLTLRGSRTILLTTHFMDEADVLGDRIAIMAAGKLQCCGSPEYLKRIYCFGFTLSMKIDPIADKNAIMTLVHTHSPEATWKNKKFSTNSDLGIILPSNGGSKSEFAALLSDLTKNKQDLGVQSIGLTTTTMDDVFIKVGELLEGEEAETSAIKTGMDFVPKSKGCCLVLLQLWALFLKRILFAWRKKILFLAQFVIPLLLLLFVILSSNSRSVEKNTPPKLTMKLSDYKNPITLYTPADDLGASYKDVVGSSAKFVQNVVEELKKAQAEDVTNFQAKYIVAADLPKPASKADPTVTAFYSSFALHAAPLSINLVSNAILKYLNIDVFIEVSNQPFLNEITVLAKPEIGPMDDMSSILYMEFIHIAFILFSGFLVIFPIEEETCKQLQVMTGVNPLIFWGASFLWDLIMVLILAGLTVVVLSFHRQDLFTICDAGGAIFLIVLVYGLTQIPFAYVCSLCLKTPTKGFIFIVLVNCLLGKHLGMFLRFEDMDETDEGILNSLSIVSRILSAPLPLVAFTATIPKYRKIADKNAECNYIPEKFKKAVCDFTGTNQPVYSELYYCCYRCDARINGYRTCHTPLPFITWTHSSRSSMRREKVAPGIGILQELFYVSLVGLFYTFILFAVEFGILGRLRSKSKAAKGKQNKPPTDEDVKVESQRVQQMIVSGQVGQDAFIAGDISKSYKEFAALSNLSFGVHHGECFGLLGVNGAGKTTAFRILTGDERSSGGDAYTLNLTLKKNKRKFLKNIGYCPQFDAIVGVFTGREMLELFARLRGIQGKYVHGQATLWLKKMGLYASRNQLCKNYSGGMKRRLSAGMALIGEPRIIMLDEPTSGVDPMSRRRFWDVLAEARNGGQSIILTSHSMEECEALCTRLGIMVNGQFQCFGEVEHLKTKFAQGFNLVLKLKPLIHPESSKLKILRQRILQKFYPCKLKDQYQNVLQYQISNQTIGWDDIFHQMEDMKTQNDELIEDYSVNETSLENVFLVLARQQYPARGSPPTSCFKNCTLCGCC